MVVRGEPGDHGKDTEECYLPKRRHWQQKRVELRTFWKVKSAGSCDHLDARAKERETPKITSRRLSGVIMPLSGSGN